MPWLQKTAPPMGFMRSGPIAPRHPRRCSAGRGNTPNSPGMKLSPALRFLPLIRKPPLLCSPSIPGPQAPAPGKSCPPKPPASALASVSATRVDWRSPKTAATSFSAAPLLNLRPQRPPRSPKICRPSTSGITKTITSSPCRRCAPKPSAIARSAPFTTSATRP